MTATKAKARLLAGILIGVAPPDSGAGQVILQADKQ